MGTNFYAHTNGCDCCKRVDIVHLGKRSAGWTFSFQGSKSVRNFDDWCALVRSADYIQDEYGRMWHAEVLIMEAATWCVGKKRHIGVYPDDGWVDQYGHSFWVDQYGHSFSEGDFS